MHPPRITTAIATMQYVSFIIHDNALSVIPTSQPFLRQTLLRQYIRPIRFHLLLAPRAVRVQAPLCQSTVLSALAAAPVIIRYLSVAMRTDKCNTARQIVLWYPFFHVQSTFCPQFEQYFGFPCSIAIHALHQCCICPFSPCRTLLFGFAGICFFTIQITSVYISCNSSSSWTSSQSSHFRSQSP